MTNIGYIFPMCDKNCCETGAILYGEYDDGIDEAEESNIDILNTYEAYEMLYAGDFGHINYALPAYCVSIGHANCLKKIATEPNFMHHNDLAMCAIEADNLECLRFIIEELGDVEFEPGKVGPNCKNYVNRLKKKLGNKTQIKRIKNDLY